MLIRLLVLLALLMPSVSHAATYWDSNFDAQDCNWRAGADNACLEVGSGVVQLDTSVAYAGAASMKFLFNYPLTGSCLASSPNYVGQCGGYWDRTFTSSATLWRRFWVRLSADFVAEPPGTKIAKIGSDGNSDWLAFGTNGNNVWQMVMANQGWPTANDTRQLWTNGSLKHDGTWQCIETYQVVNTPGVANGTFAMWLDEVQVANYTDVGWRLAGDNSLMRYTRVIRQNGQGSMWLDNYAVGDTRIGCGTAPPSPTDTVAPTTPTLTATAGNAVVQLSWTASSDTSGILRYNIQRSTTASSGPFTSLATVNGSTTSYQDTGLTNGTTYYYRVSATDQSPAANTSPYSTYASAAPAAPGGSSATTLTITPTGRFSINGVSTLLKCISYYDIMNYHTSDIDALAADGFNCLIGHVDDVLRNNVNSAYNADGSIKAAKQTAIEAAIDYADTKGMVVLLNCTYADVDGTNSAAWLTSPSVTTAIGVAITNCINAFEANGNVMFSIVNEHIYGSYADTHAEMQTWMTTARAACATCLIGFSSTDMYGTYPAGGHLFTTQDGAVVNTTNVEAELATGVNFLLWHDERNSGFNSRALARASAMRSYLDNNGHQNIPFFGDEPAREGAGGLGTSAAWIAYYQALQTGGIQGLTLHTDAAFDLDPTQAIPDQTDVVEEAVMDGLTTALTTGTGQIRDTATITDTFDRANNTDLGATWAPETLSHTNLQIVGNRVRPTSTSTESRETRTDTMPNNQWACVTISTLTTTGSYPWAMVMLRYTAPGTGSGYDFRAYGKAYGGVTTVIAAKDANIPRTLASNTTTWAAGDQLCAEAVGSTLTLYKNSVAVATATDTTYASGRVGLYAWSDNAVADVELDSFTAGGFTTPPVITTPQILSLSSTTAGAMFTYSGSLASTDACTANGCINRTLAETPSGVITYNWLPTDGFVCVYPIDPNGARNNTNYVCVPVTSATDVTAPTILNPAPSGNLIAGTTSTTLSWNTSEPSTCKLDTSNVAYASMSLSPVGGGLGTAFTYTASGLANSTTYNYYVACIDEAGNISATTHITFSVETPASVDTTRPSTVTNLAATVLSTSQIYYTWTAATDNVALSTTNPYRLYLCSDSVCTTQSIYTTTTNTSATMAGIPPGTTIYATVTAVDSSNNESAANSNIVTATTQPIVLIDTVPPSDPVGLTITAYPNSALFQWTPGTDDQGPVTTAIEVCSGSTACTAFALQKVATGSSALITGLTASTVYRGRIIHIDEAGNPSANYSSRVGFTTPPSTGGGITQPRAPVSFAQPRTAVGTARAPRN